MKVIQSKYYNSGSRKSTTAVW